MFCKHSCFEWTGVAGTSRSVVQDVPVAFIGWATCCPQGGPSYVPRPSLKLIIIDHIFISVTGISSPVNILVSWLSREVYCQTVNQNQYYVVQQAIVCEVIRTLWRYTSLPIPPTSRRCLEHAKGLAGFGGLHPFPPLFSSHTSFAVPFATLSECVALGVPVQCSSKYIGPDPSVRPHGVAFSCLPFLNTRSIACGIIRRFSKESPVMNTHVLGNSDCKTVTFAVKLRVSEFSVCCLKADVNCQSYAVCFVSSGMWYCVVWYGHSLTHTRQFFVKQPAACTFKAAGGSRHRVADRMTSCPIRLINVEV